MEKTDPRIAVIGIIIEDREKAEQVNSLLHQYGEYIIGRMGIPYREKQVNIISVVLDAPADVISALEESWEDFRESVPRPYIPGRRQTGRKPNNGK